MDPVEDPEIMHERLDDLDLVRIAKSRQCEQGIQVDLDDL